MQNISITEQYIRKLSYSKEYLGKDGAKQYPAEYHRDKNLKGFCVRVYPSGHISFCICYRNKSGTQKYLFFADYPKVSVADARELAKGYFIRIASGIDVQAERGISIRSST